MLTVGLGLEVGIEDVELVLLLVNDRPTVSTEITISIFLQWNLQTYIASLELLDVNTCSLPVTD